MNILKNNMLLHKTAYLTMLSMGANFLGFLIPIYIGYKYGVSKETDDFFLSYSIIIFIGIVFTESVRSVSVPFLSERLGNKIEYDTFVSTVFFFLLRWLGLFSIITIVIAFSSLALWDYPITRYLALSVPIFFFMVINAFYYGILNSLNKFYLAETSPFSRGIIIFVFIYLFSDSIGITAVILGYLFGEFTKFIHLHYVIFFKNDISLSPTYYDSNIIKGFLNISQYQIYSSSIAASYPFIARTAASFLAIGSISIIEYGDRLFMIFNVLLNSFLVVVLSKWSKDILTTDFDFKGMKNILMWVSLIATILAIIVAISKRELVEILYPSLNQQEKTLVANILALNMISFIFSSLSQVINRAIIVLKITKILFKASVLKIIVNIIFTIILGAIWGLIGIVLSAVIVQLFGLILNYLLFKNSYKNISTVRYSNA